MKILTLTLAEHASTREGMLSMLGGYINQFMRPEFPATLGADLVVVAAPDENEIRAGKVSSEFRFWCVREGYSEPIFEGNGRLDSESSGGREGVMPMALDLRNIRIDGPGTYIQSTSNLIVRFWKHSRFT